MNENTTSAVILLFSSTLGLLSLADNDIILAITLKCVSILSFGIAIGYAVWKWKSELKKVKHFKKK